MILRSINSIITITLENINLLDLCHFSVNVLRFSVFKKKVKYKGEQESQMMLLRDRRE